MAEEWDGYIPPENPIKALVPAENEDGAIRKAPAATKQEFQIWRSQRFMPILRNLPDMAIYEERPDIVAYLREDGVDFYYQLLRAARHNDTKSLKILIAGGIDINHDAGKHHYAINAAARAGAYKAVVMLLENGADMNQRGRYSETPLMWAAYHDDMNLFRILKAAGANPSLRKLKPAFENQTAFSIARHMGHGTIAEALDKYEALEWRDRKPAALPAPETKLLPAPAQAACPEGWSIVNENGAEMAIQAIGGPASSIRMRNIFDFAGKRLLTEFMSVTGAPLLSEKNFAEADPDFVARARRIFDDAKKAGEISAPGLI
jgi:hypothetical protein